MEALFALLNAIEPLSAALTEGILSYLKRSEVVKKQILLKEGEIARYIYFVEKGLVRSYFYSDKKEVTGWIMKDGDIAASVQSFFFQAASYETVEVLEDSVLYSITYEQLKALYTKHREFNLHRAEILQDYYAKSERRHLMRNQPAYDRYLFLMEHHQDLIGKVANKYLASYLNMSQSAFSQQKAKFAKKDKGGKP